MNTYCIKDGYTARSGYTHYDDTAMSDEYQLEVYLHAWGLMKKYNLKSVLDIGCGSGYKLMTYLNDYETTGIELPVNVDFLRAKYPQRQWITKDFSEQMDRPYDVIICSDVVEHIPDPDQLLDFISRIRFNFLVMSTPERDVLYMGGRKGSEGPPANPAHVREWNSAEFHRYLSTKFQVLELRVCNLAQATQMAVARPLQAP
jgi:SAM-dependent methyltransferase